MRYIILFLLVATSASAQQWRYGKNVSEVYASLAPSHALVDTVQFDDPDAEGNFLTRQLRFAPFEFAGVKGILTVSFDRKGRTVLYKFMRGSYLQRYEGVSEFYFSYSDPRQAIIDSMASDGKKVQLENFAAVMGLKFGKPTRADEHNSISYVWKKKGEIIARATLIEGDLIAVWQH
jgi:hypothetical protein